MRVLIFGDSITQGFTDTQGGWVTRLISNYNKQIVNNLDDDWNEVFNLGISGDTTQGVINRLENEVKARQLYRETDVLVFAIGTNDTIFRGNETESNPDKYGQELKELFENALNITNRILFVGMCGVDDKISNPWKYSSSGKSFSTDRIREFEGVLSAFCQENKLPYVCVIHEFTSDMFVDGIHPNDKGHELIYQKVKPELEKLLT